MLKTSPHELGGMYHVCYIIHGPFNLWLNHGMLIWISYICFCLNGGHTFQRPLYHPPPNPSFCFSFSWLLMLKIKIENEIEMTACCHNFPPVFLFIIYYLEWFYNDFISVYKKF